MKANNDSLFKIIDGTCYYVHEKTEAEEKAQYFGLHDQQCFEIINHSGAHLLAQAVMELYPEVEYGIGPAVEKGFYYDFFTSKPFTPEDLVDISKKMKFLIKQNFKIEKLIWKKDEAIKYFTERNQNLKVELIQEKVDTDTLTVFKQGEFVDLCRGPHLPSTKYLKNFKLTSVAASYWKGDEKNHSMQRIYGIVFSNREKLDAHLELLKQAKARDHRKLGRELDLFTIQESIGAGLVLWHPKGSIIRHEIENYWKEEHLMDDYGFIYSPHIGRHDMWQKSGHTEFYQDNMFTPIEFDNIKYQLKPMNCPFHIASYQSRNRSYKEFPLRWAELGTVYRYERSGVLHGLLRVRGFTQDDAHIFCSPNQLAAEIHRLLDFSIKLLNTFGFKDLEIFLSTRPEKYVGEISDWELATESLKNALIKKGIDYRIDEGEGVFYGPKIDIKVKDVLLRSWQCTTIQIDFNLPGRFNLKYIDEKGQIKKPIMIHRALLGSLERFIGILIEHYAGFFPVWLAPLQIVLLPINDRNVNYAKEIYSKMKQNRLRVKLDDRSEGLGKKIRDAEIEKIPYIIILGDEEEKNDKLSYRIHKRGDKGQIELNEFIKGVKKIINSKELNYEL
jgi:threonyl-tRNA synthetase